jgi:hypothetical protein
MTPKEKATELIEKFYNVEHCGIRHFPNQKYCDCEGGMNDYMAKQSALIAIEEIINVCESYVSPYYYEVRKEIENQ